MHKGLFGVGDGSSLQILTFLKSRRWNDGGPKPGREPCVGVLVQTLKSLSSGVPIAAQQKQI